MQSLEHWNQKIFMRSRNIPFRDFVKAICSWMPANFYKYDGVITSFPRTDRTEKMISAGEYAKNPDLFASFARDYDENQSFFENFSRFFRETPRVAVRQLPPIENSEYTEISGWGIKDCYLSLGVVMDSTKVLYSFEVKENCHDIYNSVMVWDNCSQIYQSNSVLRSSKVFYSRFIYNSSDIYWSSNLVGCHECILCDGLENASYHIGNIAYTKDAYEAEKQKILHDRKDYWDRYLAVSTVGANLVSTNTTGSYATNCKNVTNGYYSYNTVNARNIVLVGSQ